MRGTEVSEFIDSAYIWQERAIKAEAENIKLRAVVDAARVYVVEHDKIPNLRTLDEWIIIVAAIRNALAELDKEGEE
jgi:hypothetical protein